MAGNSRRFAMNSIAETLREFSERFEVEDSMHINSLPDELLLRIFQYVDLEDRVDWVSRVCLRWERLCCDASLWRHVELEYEPGRHAFRKQMLHLAPCLKSLKLLLPAGEDVTFQEHELHPLPADIRRLTVAFAPGTVPLMLKALEKVLRHVRELELLPADKHPRDSVPRLKGTARMLDFHRSLCEASEPRCLFANLLPEAHVRRFWELLQDSQLETLVIRGWTVGLLERRRGSGLLVEGPLAPSLRNFLVLAAQPSPVAGMTSPFLSGTLQAFVRCQSRSLRSVLVFGKVLESRRELQAAISACPNLVESALCNATFESYGVTISGSWDTMEVEMLQDDPQLTAFISLSYVQGRVTELIVRHNANIWGPLMTWSNLRSLEIIHSGRLNLPRPLSEVLLALPNLERLSISGADEFVLGLLHLYSITPAVAPSLKLLQIRHVCRTACVCKAEPKIRSSFSGKDFTCVFICNQGLADV